MSKCKVDGCGKEVHAKGLCTAHYTRMLKHGDLKLRKAMDGYAKRYPEEYVVFNGMKGRVQKRSAKSKRYYDRGITICPRWLGPDGFRHFMEDMGPRPKDRLPGGHIKYSIDRIDNNKGYSPDNCRWTDPHTQAKNREYCGAVPGVTKSSKNNTWRAGIKINGRQISKYFSTYEEAVAQRKAWEQKSPFD